MQEKQFDILLPELRPYFLEALDGQGVATIYGGKLTYAEGGLKTDNEIVRVSPRNAFIHGVRTRSNVIVLPEPLWFRQYPLTVPFIAGVLLGHLARLQKPKLGTICIDNAPASEVLKLPSLVPAKLRKVLGTIVMLPQSLLLSYWIFGTDAARNTYKALLGPIFDRRVAPKSQLILPKPRQRGVTEGKPTQFAFIGRLNELKGVPLMLEAWDKIAEVRPDATLHIAGIGEMEDAVVVWARSRPEVKVEIDVSRERVFEILSQCGMHFQLSMPRKRGGEQVGSANIEALSMGLRLVVTSETGISEWLKTLGHVVVDPAISSENLAKVILDVLDKPWSPPANSFFTEDGLAYQHRVLLQQLMS